MEGTIPIKMQRNDMIHMATRIFHGGSGGRNPESFWKNTNQGNLMPACRNTPAEAATNINHTQGIPASAAALVSNDFVTKPEVNGTADIANAPIIPLRLLLALFEIVHQGQYICVCQSSATHYQQTSVVNLYRWCEQKHVLLRHLKRAHYRYQSQRP